MRNESINFGLSSLYIQNSKLCMCIEMKKDLINLRNKKIIREIYQSCYLKCA